MKELYLKCNHLKFIILNRFAYEQGFAEIFLNRAFYSISNLEMLKWVTVFLMSQLHLTVVQTKPFNPILGETYQVKIGKLSLYIEHIVNKPPIFRFYGKSELYTISGYQSLEAKTGANSIKAFKTGKYQIVFKGGQIFDIYPPTLMVKGLNVGNRILYYRRSTVIVHVVSIYFY